MTFPILGKYLLGIFLVLMVGACDQFIRPYPDTTIMSPTIIPPTIIPPPSCSEYATFAEKGERQLIVISTGKGLDKFGREIQQTLDKVKLSNSTTLVAIYKGELTKPSSWRKIRFGASVDALQELKLINEEYEGKFARVLYLTDNGSMPSDSNWAEIDPNTLTIPCSWKNAGIEMLVFTTKSCTAWTETGITAKCTKLKDRSQLNAGEKDPMELFEQGLDDFISGK